MPDLFLVLARRWRFILFLTALGVAVALVASLLSPRLYRSEATALPGNPVLSDKARLFNVNIEGLYADVGGANELDRIEGTAQLDTLYLSVAKAQNLVAHYGANGSQSVALHLAAQQLKKATDIRRSAYGELKVAVWDKDPQMAANLANSLLQTLNTLHEAVQSQNNKLVLQRLKEIYTRKQTEQTEFERNVVQYKTFDAHDTAPPRRMDAPTERNIDGTVVAERLAAASDLPTYRRLISEYEVAIETAPQPLLVVEAARAPVVSDRPKTIRNALLALAASFFFAFLLAVYLESRRPA